MSPFIQHYAKVSLVAQTTSGITLSDSENKTPGLITASPKPVDSDQMLSCWKILPQVC